MALQGQPMEEQLLRSSGPAAIGNSIWGKTVNLSASVSCLRNGSYNNTSLPELLREFEITHVKIAECYINANCSSGPRLHGIHTVHSLKPATPGVYGHHLPRRYRSRDAAVQMLTFPLREHLIQK